MAPKATVSLAFLLTLNLLFFSLVSAEDGKMCPIDTLKLNVCAKLLEGLVDVRIGKSPESSCCSLIKGLVDVDAAVCLCTALKANVLGIDLNIPSSLSLLLNVCHKNAPIGFQC